MFTVLIVMAGNLNFILTNWNHNINQNLYFQKPCLKFNIKSKNTAQVDLSFISLLIKSFILIIK